MLQSVSNTPSITPTSLPAVKSALAAAGAQDQVPAAPVAGDQSQVAAPELGAAAHVDLDQVEIPQQFADNGRPSTTNSGTRSGRG
jgi:hypothetical protein